MPSKRDMLQGAATLVSADAAIYGNSSALVAAGFQRSEVGWRFSRVTLTPVALSLPDDFTPDEWDDLGRALGEVGGALQWWQADLILAGENRYGVTYQRAMEVTGLEYKTLANMVSVARKFESSRRRESLSFAHHAAVAALAVDEQDAWLDYAAQEGLSVAKLKAAMRPEKAKPKRHLKVIRQRFTRLWKAVAAGGEWSAEDVAELEEWLREVKGRGEARKDGEA